MKILMLFLAFSFLALAVGCAFVNASAGIVSERGAMPLFETSALFFIAAALF